MSSFESQVTGLLQRLVEDQANVTSALQRLDQRLGIVEQTLERSTRSGSGSSDGAVDVASQPSGSVNHEDPPAASSASSSVDDTTMTTTTSSSSSSNRNPENVVVVVQGDDREQQQPSKTVVSGDATADAVATAATQEEDSSSSSSTVNKDATVISKDDKGTVPSADDAVVSKSAEAEPSKADSSSSFVDNSAPSEDRLKAPENGDSSPLPNAGSNSPSLRRVSAAAGSTSGEELGRVKFSQGGKLMMLGGGISFGKKDSSKPVSAAASTPDGDDNSAPKAEKPSPEQPATVASKSTPAVEATPIQPKTVTPTPPVPQEVPIETRIRDAIDDYIKHAPRLHAVLALKADTQLDIFERHRDTWSVVASIVSLFRMVLSPLHAAFPEFAHHSDHSSRGWFKFLDILFFFALAIDIVWQWRLHPRRVLTGEPGAVKGPGAVTTTTGNNSASTGPIVVEPGYIDSWYFVADLVAVCSLACHRFMSFPWDEVLLLFSSLLKVRRLLSARKEVERRISGNPSVFRLAVLVFLSFLAAHWVGCLWFAVGDIVGYGSDSWVPSLEVSSMSLWARYVFALFWGFGNVTTTYSAEPVTALEAVFQLVVLFFSVSMYATLLGNVATLLSNADNAAMAWQEKMDAINTYMHMRGVPENLRRRVDAYYDYVWQRQSGLDENSVLDDLPIAVKTDIAQHLHGSLLSKVPFLKRASPEFLNVLVRVLRPCVFAPNETIIRHGDVGKEMYFLSEGVVVVQSGDGSRIFNVLTDGAFFGEYALLFSQKRSATVKSKTYCDLFVLTQSDFDDVLADFPEFETMIRRESIKRVLVQIPFFSGLRDEIMEYFVENLKAQAFSDGKYLISAGDVGCEMYFLTKGSVEVVSEDGRTTFTTLKEGSFFGEIALLFDMKRTASVRSLGHSDVFVLTKANFEEAQRLFVDFGEKMHEVRATYKFKN